MSETADPLSTRALDNAAPFAGNERVGSSGHSRPGELEDMSRKRVFAIWLSIIFGVLCTFLDEGIISTAIPRITDEFQSLGDIGVRLLANRILKCAMEACGGNASGPD